MSINSSSSTTNASHPFSVLSSTSSNYFICFNSTTASYILSAFATTNILLLLPLYILVLYVGFQRRRRSTSMKTATSHADFFTYHMVAIEIFGLFGSGIYCISNYTKNMQMTMVGFYIFSLILPGQTLFHLLTCVEHYLAVVHPITYMGLKNGGGARIRNISIGFVWLACAGWVGVAHVYLPDIPLVPLFVSHAFSLFVSALCSFSVLHALTRRSPREGGRDRERERVDQSKQRAFYTIMAIIGTLLLRFVGFMAFLVIYKFVETRGGDVCLVITNAFWVCLPSSLVLPLLFLQRAGKLACCRNNTAAP